MTVDRSHLLALLDTAPRMTADALTTTAGAPIFRSIGAQLHAIRENVRVGGPFDPALQRRINIGLLAVREFEQSDPEYAKLLEQIAFLYQDEGVLR